MTKEYHKAFNDIVSSLEKHPDRIALIDKDGKKYTYREFRRYITGARTELSKRGVRKGSKVLVFVPMSLELYAILEALFSLGATAIFLDPWMKGKKMGEVIEQVEPDLFVVTNKIARLAVFLRSTWGLDKWKFKSITPNDNEWLIEPNILDNDNALITFTSGTSGKPKGANRTFAFLNAQEQTLKHHLKGEEHIAYVDYTNFPIVGLADFAMGNTVVIPRINLMKIHEADPLALIDHLKEVGAMRLIVSPSLLNKIIEGKKEKGIDTISHAVTGGAPIPISLIQECISNHTDIFFEAIYGSTEAEPICTCTFQEVAERLNKPRKGVYVGVPIDAIQLKIIKYKDAPIEAPYLQRYELPDGEIGEIVVTGAHVNKTYFKNKAAFKRSKVVDENEVVWHRTGDMGYQENGAIYLVGRDHRIMDDDGKKYYPYPIEQYVEVRLGFKDVGYLQMHTGEFVLYIGQQEKLDTDQIQDAVLAAGYPCDKVIVWDKPLPRDARHKSKLQIEELI